MAHKLNEKQETEIVMKLAEGESYASLAKEYGVTPPTIRNIKNRRTDFLKIFTQKKEENAISFLEHMESRRNDAFITFDKLLSALSDDEKIAKATLNQIATSLGILVDKFTAREQPTKNNDAKNNLLEAIAGIAKPEGLDDEV